MQTHVLIYSCILVALISALIFARRVLGVNIAADPEKTPQLKRISDAISEGAMAFLSSEYRYVAGFCGAFAILLYFTASTHGVSGIYSAVAFLLGALVSSLAAFLGMIIAVRGNVRTTVMARQALSAAFKVAFNSGAVMGFGLCGLALFGLYSLSLVYRYLISDPYVAMEMVAGFGLGGSTVALFGRVGGGIFTKAADVGADLVGKVEAGIPEDDPRNPAVIADNVGDNVGDIAGMGADLFGSLAEASCAALMIGASAPLLVASSSAFYFPLLVSAVGIPVCLITAMFVRVNEEETSVEKALKGQLIISTVLMTVAVILLSNWALPESFLLGGQIISRNGVLLGVLSGLWGGLLIGFITEYYTSHTYQPVRQIASASKTGAATNIIYGLSLGYRSTVLAVLVIAGVVYSSWHYAGMYGIAMAAIGMISTIAIGLTIDAYGPVSDNAGGIAEMTGLEKVVRTRTDILDAAGNTTAAIGKGFAIGSAVLTALALFAAFLTRVEIYSLNLLEPRVFAGILAGATLPMLFSAQTMRAVGTAAFAMIEEVRRQFRETPGLMEGKVEPDYRSCVSLSTTAALAQMIAPGMLVILSPLVFGILFGLESLAGLLAGALTVAVVQAISASNSGGAWDNAKKYIEAGAHGGKGSETHKAAVVGDTVGDPMKDTSGPSLNILMKLMAITSLVFAPFIGRFHSTITSLIGF